MLLWYRARGVSQDQMRACGKASVAWSWARRHGQSPEDRGLPLHLWQPRNWGRSHVRPPRELENFSLDQGSHRRQGPSWRPLQSPCQARLSSSARPPRGGQLPAQSKGKAAEGTGRSLCSARPAGLGGCAKV